MKKVCLYYFSGTGMTKHVVERLADEIKSRHVSVDCFKIEAVNGRNVALSDYDALIIAYPTHSLNAPKIVADFVKQLPKSNSGTNTFIIHTCSADDAVNYGSSDLLIKRLSKKGYCICYNRLIEMPSNFANKHSEQQAIKTLAAANDSVARIAEDIIALKPYPSKERHLGLRALTWLARIEWFGAPIIGKFFYAKDGCDCCGKCVDNCPKKNIVMKKGAVGFKWSCGICMRCIYQCPKNIISVRKPFKFIRFDKWYDSEIFR